MKALLSLCCMMLLGIFSFLLTSNAASSAVAIEGIRFIYPAKANEITIKMVNKGDAPSLMQLWVDRGDSTVSFQDSDAPFLITPPIVRIDPRNGQSVRMIFTGEALPQDRESLFWFNALEIPPVSVEQDRSSLQIAVRSRLKLFYRPTNLVGEAVDAPSQVNWRVIPLANGGYALRGNNPTPYYITYRQLVLQMGKKNYNLGSGMIAPFSSEDFNIKGMHSYSGQFQLTYQPMTDYGVGAEQTFSLR
ncbi:fimbrial biogenesis chaperone [Serratia fonticola]|uniref:fimbrial biogenesis chaperone n=1 Tax=Serratia fonticola TaxID=47917 RepID=UPI0003AEA073|nr:fimbria/pilus periplasmic chaperone [Serratia fonticola]ERK05889.1 pili assembly chaperone:Bacterial pili assembly chaperone [Serratia fonticola AU-AP2C]MBP1037071.1 fimbria/pilus periplasmic chaperone [Serratia fonticola]